jgi:hypothetical protein
MPPDTQQYDREPSPFGGPKTIIAARSCAPPKVLNGREHARFFDQQLHRAAS